MEGVAIVVGAVIAVGGWIVSGWLARRSVRRQMRVEFLLSAYRRLEAASNRATTEGHAQAIESALSDVQLLGTHEQVRLVDEFSRVFAATGTADSGPLLEELRRALRDELLLEELVPRRTWLRITSEGQWAEKEASVKALTLPLPDTERRRPLVHERLIHFG